MPTRNVVLTDRQAAMVTRLVGSGRYQNASEVIREGLRLIERREIEDDARLSALREAVVNGATDIDEGRYRDFNTTESLRDHLSAMANEALADRLPRGGGNR